MQRNFTKTIDANKELKILTEITEKNYNKIVIFYNSKSKNIPLAKDDFEILVNNEAIEKKNRNLKYRDFVIFESKTLTNLLESYFDGSLSEQCDCCICYEEVDTSCFLVGPKASTRACSDCSAQFKHDPNSREEFTNRINLDIIPWLKEQMKKVPAMLELAFEENDPDKIAELLNNGENPDYKSFTKAVDQGKWEATAAFVMHNHLVRLDDYILDIYSHNLLKAVFANQFPLASALLKKGARMGCVYNDENFGFGAIHCAIYHHKKNPELLDLIMRYKPDVNAQYCANGRKGPTPLAIAFQANDPDAIQVLLRNKATPDYFLFETAVNQGQWELAIAFVYANPCQDKKNEARNYYYNHAYTKAVKANSRRLINALDYVGFVSMEHIISNNDFELLTKKIYCGEINPNAKMKLSNKTPLQYAFEINPDAIGILLKGGAIPDYSLLDKSFETNIKATLEFVKNNNYADAALNYCRMNALSRAAKCKNNEALLKSLYEAGCGKIFKAIEKTNVKFLWEDDFNLVETNENNETPLQFAFRKRNTSAIAILLNNGVERDYDLNEWLSLMHYAIDHGNHEILEILLKKNTNSNILLKSSNAPSPLDKAIQMDDPVAVNLLMLHGAKPDYNSLEYAIKVLRHFKAAAAFVKNNTDPDASRIYSEMNILYLSRPIGNSTVDSSHLTTCLHEAGCGATHIAIENHDNAALEDLLINKKSNVNEKNEKGQTLLDLAFISNNIVGMKLILSLNAKPGNNARSEFSFSVFNKHDWDLALAFVQNFNYLNDSNISIWQQLYCQVLLEASRNGQLSLVVALISKGIPINHISYQTGFTALHYAIKNQDYKLTKYLLNAKADPNQFYSDDFFTGLTPLQLAFQQANGDIIHLLLESGAEPDYKSFIKAIDDKHWTIAFAFIMSNKQLLNNENCKNAYYLALTKIADEDTVPKLLINALLPVMLFKLTNEIMESLSDDSKNSCKGDLLYQFINKLSNTHISLGLGEAENTLRKIIALALQRQKFTFWIDVQPKSSITLCTRLLNPEYKYLLEIICDEKNKTSLTEDDLIAYVLNKPIDTLVKTGSGLTS